MAKYIPHKQLNKALFKVGQYGVRGMTRDELKQVGLPIIREAKKRVRELEKAGLTDSPAYRAYVIEKKMKISTAGKNINAIKNEVREAWAFLNARTSTVEGASDYNRWLDDHLGARTTKEQRESIWDLVHRFEETHPGKFINYGYDEAIRKIAKAAELADYNIDKAYNIFSQYLAGQRDIADMEIDAGKELDENGATPWFKGRSSTNGF